jgi:hypothetical protein
VNNNNNNNNTNNNNNNNNNNNSDEARTTYEFNKLLPPRRAPTRMAANCRQMSSLSGRRELMKSSTNCRPPK